MRRLFPVTHETADGEGRRTTEDREWTLEELAAEYAYPGQAERTPVAALSADTVADPGALDPTVGAGSVGAGPSGAGSVDASPEETPSAEAPSAVTPPAEAPSGVTPPAEASAAEAPPSDVPPADAAPADAAPADGPPADAPPAHAPLPADARVWVRANMVSTLDGAGQYEGRTQPISGASDMKIFGTLRGLADVVVVGAQTVRQEGYRPARARKEFAARRAAAGQSPAPAIAVVSASLDLDFGLPLFTSPVVPTLLVTGQKAPAGRVAAAKEAGVELVFAGTGAGVEPALVVRELAVRGLSRLLLEGGPRLLGQFVAAGVLDELCLTLSPMLTAGAAQRIAGGPSVAVPARFVPAGLLEDEGFLFARYHRSR